MVDFLRMTSDEGVIKRYQQIRDEANRLALELERRGYKGEYVTPSGRRGDLNPYTRPTQFVWTKP